VIILLLIVSSRHPTSIKLGTCSFICQSTSTSEVTFSVFESSCHLLLPDLPLKGKGNLVGVKCLADGHNKWTSRLVITQ